MDDRDPTNREQPNRDHWEIFAETTDLTIEGHRLIAQEIIYEVKLLWRRIRDWAYSIAGASMRRGSPPPR